VGRLSGEGVETRPTRLEGSGTVPRVFALVLLVIVTGFLVGWVSTRPDGLLDPLVWVIAALAVALALRSLFVGVFLDRDAVLVRGWFRSYRYERGGLRTVAAVPYWRFLDRKDPILSCLRFTPASGWVREISATVAWRDRAAAHAAAVTRHLA
jgi:hypothetical protein